MPWLPSLNPGINTEEKAKIHSKIEEWQMRDGATAYTSQ